MTIGLNTDQTPAAPPRTLLRILLIGLSAILMLGAYRNSALALDDYSQILTLLTAGAALLLAVAGRVRHAIMALGAVMLIAWANELSSIALHGLQLPRGYLGVVHFAQAIIYPVIALTAIWLAARDRLLGLAFAFVALPTVEFWIGVAAFAISVTMYGF